MKKYLVIRFGKAYKNLMYGIPYDVLIEEAGLRLGLSKSKVKQYDKEKGIHLEIR